MGVAVGYRSPIYRTNVVCTLMHGGDATLPIVSGNLILSADSQVAAHAYGCSVQSYSHKSRARRRWSWRLPHRKGRTRPQENRPANGTYRQRVAVSRDVARARFAAFVKRALRDARDRGMTDQSIQRATGVTQSTFHRWQQGEGGLPTINKVRAFCDGLDLPLRPALIALGMDDAREPTPEAPPDPDLTRIARILADPNVSEAEKLAIRHTIRMLSRAARAARSETEPAE